jgi:hypothetical protein
MRELLNKNNLIHTELFIEGTHLPSPELACSAELMVHVALPAAAEQKSRLREYAVLADEGFARSIRAPEYDCCSFAALAETHGQCMQGGAEG